jgi:hypothetical protein
MQQIETIERLVKPLVMTGLYRDQISAFKAIVTDYINRKKMEYDGIISSFQKKYDKSFEEFSRDILNSATMEVEDDWMEWKGALEMRGSWSEAYRLSLHDEAI